MTLPQIRAYFLYDFGPWTGPWASQTAYFEAPALGLAPWEHLAVRDVAALQAAARTVPQPFEKSKSPESMISQGCEHVKNVLFWKWTFSWFLSFMTKYIFRMFPGNENRNRNWKCDKWKTLKKALKTYGFRNVLRNEYSGNILLGRVPSWNIP